MVHHNFRVLFWTQQCWDSAEILLRLLKFALEITKSEGIHIVTRWHWISHHFPMLSQLQNAPKLLLFLKSWVCGLEVWTCSALLWDLSSLYFETLTYSSEFDSLEQTNLGDALRYVPKTFSTKHSIYLFDWHFTLLLKSNLTIKR